MDYGYARAVTMLVLLAIFLAITIWAWSSRQRSRFDAAARLPFDDERVGTEAGTQEPRA